MIHTNFVLIFFLLLTNLVIAQDQPELIAPDRPGFGDAVSIVGQGQLQLETGFQLEQSANNVRFKRVISLNSTLLRYGINDRVEARFDYNLLRNSFGFTSTGKEVSDFTEIGLAPCRLGLKANILKNKGIIPELTFISMLGLPWATTSGFRSAGVSPDLQLSFSNGINNIMSICYNLGLNWDGSSANPQNYYAISAEFCFKDKIGTYIQARGATQKEFIGVNNNVTYLSTFYTEAGVMFYPKYNMQIDLSGGLKVGEFRSDNIQIGNYNYFFFTAGFSYNFAK